MAKFKKISGKHYVKGKKYIVGDIIDCSKEDIKNFLDTFEELEPAEEVKPEPLETSLRAEHKGAGRYDVVNTATGKAINDRLLNREEADSLINDATMPIEDE